MREALARCSRRDDTDLAIISSRGLSDVRRMVDNDGFVFAGNHGLGSQGRESRPIAIRTSHYERRAVELVSELERIEAEGAWSSRAPR